MHIIEAGTRGTGSVHVRRPVFGGHLVEHESLASRRDGCHHSSHIYEASNPAALETLPEFSPDSAVLFDEAHNIISVKSRAANHFGFHMTNLHTIHGEECVELYENCQARRATI